MKYNVTSINLSTPGQKSPSGTQGTSPIRRRLTIAGWLFATTLVALSCSPNQEEYLDKYDVTNLNDVATLDVTQDTDISIDSDESLNDIIEDDISEDSHDDNSVPALQDISFDNLEGMVHFQWILPDDSLITEIRVTASPKELMWGDAHRIIEAPGSSLLFDKLINEVEYQFKIQAYAEEREIGEARIINARPFARPLLAVSRGTYILNAEASTNMVDGVTKKQALGWDSLIQAESSAHNWSPDGTKFVTVLAASVTGHIVCVIFDRVTRQVLQVDFPREFSEMCAPYAFSWAPDSQRLAFVRNSTNDTTSANNDYNYSIYNLLTQEVEHDWPDLHQLNIANIEPILDWSKDGKYLAIPVKMQDYSIKLFIINAATKSIEPEWIDYSATSFGQEIRSLSWSPDSRRLAIIYNSPIYTEELGREAIYHIFNTETKQIESGWPESNLRHLSYARWSPDGDLLVLSNDLGHHPSLQVINTETLENAPGWHTDWPRIQDVAWSHDSQLLAMSSVEHPFLIVIDRDDKMADANWTPLDKVGKKLSWSPVHPPPSAPVAVALTRQDGVAELSWSAPADGVILDYRVTIEPASAVSGPADYLIRDARATSHQIDGLDPQTEASVSIRAISAFGVGVPVSVAIP